MRHPGNIVTRSATTEGEGMYIIADLPPGPALLVARSEGYAPFVGSTTVEEGKTREASVGLLLAAQVAGVVVQDGVSEPEPVAGAIVTATYPNLAGAGLVESFIGGRPITGPEGAFSFDGLIPDTAIALQAQLGDRSSGVHTVSVGPGMQRVNVIITLP